MEHQHQTNTSSSISLHHVIIRVWDFSSTNFNCIPFDCRIIPVVIYNLSFCLYTFPSFSAQFWNLYRPPVTFFHPLWYTCCHQSSIEDVYSFISHPFYNNETSIDNFLSLPFDISAVKTTYLTALTMAFKPLPELHNINHRTIGFFLTPLSAWSLNHTHLNWYKVEHNEIGK